ncbi:tRNA pseudouridine(55) synthase TruB [Subtercola vilae]|uniref:tRNA pseudouridine(55) synthase TruB n=1 Tax=Subtercola vilae TaxID=2056433 RepID=UPI00191D737F
MGQIHTGATTKGQPRASQARRGLTQSGIVLVDKPQGITSHDVVARTRKLAGTRKVGHAGTLDPLATGLLVLGLNNSTRLLTYVVGLDKEYEAVIRLGAATTTDDSEGETIFTAPAGAVEAVQPETIAAGLAALTGDILQTPSSVSAIRVDGKRAYTRVREGETVVLDARPVTIASIDVSAATPGTDAEGNAVLDVAARITCSTGTYIRAIARDLGDALGVGGHLTALRRTRIGPFEVAHAHTLDVLDPARDLVTPADTARALFPAVQLDEIQASELRDGKRIAVDPPPPAPGTEASARGPIAAIDPDGALIGLFELRGGLSRVLVNFARDAAPLPAADAPAAAATAPTLGASA